MATPRRRFGVAVLVVLSLAGVIGLARKIEREVQWVRKRELASRLDVLARGLSEHRLSVAELDSGKRGRAAVRWDTDQGGKVCELVLDYDYEIPARLNPPVVVTLSVQVVVADGALRVNSAIVQEPFFD